VLREGVRLSRRHRALLYWCVTLLFVTGVLWLAFHYLVRVEGELGEVRHPLEPWWLKLHGAAAMIFLMILGSLARGHIRMGWKARRNRRSGATLAAVSAVLIVTGWALYYVGSESARPWISAAHWGLGLFVPLFTITHVVFGRRARRAREREQKPPAPQAAPITISADAGETLATRTRRAASR